MSHRKLKILLLSCFLIPCCVFEGFAQYWQELKGEHFKVYYTKDRVFAKEVLEKSEYYYDKIASDLGYVRYSSFWSWENRAKIYIYSEKDDYLTYIKKYDHPTWAVGIANYDDKEIISYVDSAGFLDSVLPHEITHLIFRDYVGGKNIPIWIDEGVAQWQEKGRAQFAKKKMRKLLESYTPIPIERLTTLNIGKVTNEAIVELYYVQAISLIDFLVRSYGGDNFIFFCKYLRDGKDVGEALKFTYPVSIRSVDVLHNKWLKYILDGQE